MPMNPEVKALWVAALRSGKYKQGKHTLRTNDNYYCCLGVLCEIAVATEGVDVTHNVTARARIGDDNQQEMITYHLYDDVAGTLPDSVQEWSGLDSNPDTTVPAEDVPSKVAPFPRAFMSVAELNDLGWTFEQIADVIERDF